QRPRDVVSGTDHVDVVQRRESCGAEETDDRQVQHQACRSDDLAFDVGSERTAVRGVDFAPDSDENGAVLDVASGEDRSMVLFAPVERLRLSAEQTASTYSGVHGDLPQSKLRVPSDRALLVCKPCTR